MKLHDNLVWDRVFSPGQQVISTNSHITPFGREIKGNQDMHSETASGSIKAQPTNRSTSASQTNQSGQQLPQTASHNKLASQLSSQLAGW